MNKELKSAKKSEGKNQAFFDVLTCTNVQVYPFKESSGKTKAFARATINDQLQLTGLRVVNGANGFFVSYPLDPNYKGEDYHSIYYPLNKELREHIEQCVLEKYQEVAKS
jgi:stage V sporulation protein G